MRIQPLLETLSAPKYIDPGLSPVGSWFLFRYDEDFGLSSVREYTGRFFECCFAQTLSIFLMLIKYMGKFNYSLQTKKVHWTVLLFKVIMLKLLSNSPMDVFLTRFKRLSKLKKLLIKELNVLKHRVNGFKTINYHLSCYNKWIIKCAYGNYRPDRYMVKATSKLSSAKNKMKEALPEYLKLGMRNSHFMTSESFLPYFSFSLTPRVYMKYKVKWKKRVQVNFKFSEESSEGLEYNTNDTIPSESGSEVGGRWDESSYSSTC